jgi:hypothetical protein
MARILAAAGWGQDAGQVPEQRASAVVSVFVRDCTFSTLSPR